MPTIYRNIETPAGGSPPDILVTGGKVEIGPGATQGTDFSGQKKTVTHGLVACTDAVAIPNDTTAFVFLDTNGGAGYLDTDPDGGNLPANVTNAFAVGRAWKSDSGKYIVCQGKRGAGVNSYNIAGDPVPRKLIDAGSSGQPVQPVSPFQKGGGMTYDVRVTTTGTGNAYVTVVDHLTGQGTTKPYSGVHNLSDTLVIPTQGDVVQFTTDPGVTITVLVVKGTENI